MNFQKFCLATLVFTSMIAVGSASAASCSNATLKGVYGALDAGFAGGQVDTTLSQVTADGNGNLSGTVVNSQNGTIATATITGTYSVSKNCTGTDTVKFANGSTASGNFVLDDMKKGAQTIRIDSGVIKSGLILAQGAGTCGLNGKKATFAGNLTGTIANIGAVAVVGQLNLDGNGNITGSGTFSLNGSISSGSVSGTYTEKADCTGTAQITPQGFPSLNFAMVSVNGGKELLFIETDSGTTVSGTAQQ